MAEKQSVRIDVRDMPLDQWLRLLAHPPEGVRFVDYQFPTSEHLQEYVDTINLRSEREVYRLLLKLLIPTGTLGADNLHLESLKATFETDQDVFRAMNRRQYDRRLISYASGHSQIPPWEGTTWVLDLLPHFPRQGLDALNAYILAHAQELPDGRYAGLHDAATVIRAKFIGLPGTQHEKAQFLLDRSPRDFEHLVERLYHEMGYETRLTPPQKDGGRDVIAERQAPGKTEHLRIECKRRSDPVGVGIVRSLLGVVSDEKVNKGVLVATTRFTKPANEFASRNPRLELVSGDQLVRLMNEHLGAEWPLHVDRLLTESQLANHTPDEIPHQ